MSSGMFTRKWQQLITGYKPQALPVAPGDVFPDGFAIRTLADTPGVLLQGSQGLHRISPSPQNVVRN